MQNEEPSAADVSWFKHVFEPPGCGVLSLASVLSLDPPLRFITFG
jgi:hypothetical protein